jgi:hypothetical protein
VAVQTSTPGLFNPIPNNGNRPRPEWRPLLA